MNCDVVMTGYTRPYAAYLTSEQLGIGYAWPSPNLTAWGLSPQTWTRCLDGLNWDGV